MAANFLSHKLTDAINASRKDHHAFSELSRASYFESAEYVAGVSGRLLYVARKTKELSSTTQPQDRRDILFYKWTSPDFNRDRFGALIAEHGLNYFLSSIERTAHSEAIKLRALEDAAIFDPKDDTFLELGLREEDIDYIKSASASDRFSALSEIYNKRFYRKAYRAGSLTHYAQPKPRPSSKPWFVLSHRGLQSISRLFPALVRLRELRELIVRSPATIGYLSAKYHFRPPTSQNIITNASAVAVGIVSARREGPHGRMFTAHPDLAAELTDLFRSFDNACARHSGNPHRRKPLIINETMRDFMS